MSKVGWPDNKTIAAPWYVECFRAALRRVAVVLNSEPKIGLCHGVDLGRSDAEIDQLFIKNDWDHRIIQLNLAKEDPYTLEDEYRAEHFFYCNVEFPARRGVRVAKFLVPKPFLNWGYRRLYAPSGTPEQLEVDRFGGSIEAEAFIRHCATNYLVKNFWHNFVHRVIQGITNDNYHEFRGPAREDSDFEADNLANVLLARSYGYPILTRGQIGANTSERIAALFRRNRCNLIFAERAQHRGADRARMEREELWEELEWRFCRGVANLISMRLIAEGLVTPSLRIFLSGEVRSAKLRDRNSRKTWRTGHVAIELSGRRFNSKCPPYIPDDELRNELFKHEMTQDRSKAIRVMRAKREQEIAGSVVVAYRQLIHSDEQLRSSVAQALKAVGVRARIPLVDGS